MRLFDIPVNDKPAARLQRQGSDGAADEANGRASRTSPEVGRGDDTVGDPHRAGISQLELFELILLLKLDKYFSIEQFEPTVSQSTVSSPPLTKGW